MIGVKENESLLRDKKVYKKCCGYQKVERNLGESA